LTAGVNKTTGEPARVASDFYAAFAPWRLRPRPTNYIHNCRTYTAHRLSLLLRFLAGAIRTLVDPADPNQSADSSVTIQFGGCDGKIPNCLPVMNGWN
jgi:hypothetical protein